MAVLSQIVAALAGEAGEPDRLAIDRKPFRTAFAERGIAACIPPKENPTQPIPCDRTLHRIEIALGRLKDWCHITTRSDRCAPIFSGAITCAAIVIFRRGR